MVGDKVDYYSRSHTCWMPATVVQVDEETGALHIDVKPGTSFSLADQRSQLRERTRPKASHHDWVRAMLHQGRIEEEAQKLFHKYAVDQALLQTEIAAHRGRGPSLAGLADIDGDNQVLPQQALKEVGAEIDQLLGVSGSFPRLSHEILLCEGHVFRRDTFMSAFWELLWGMQQEYGHAPRREASVQPRPDTPSTVYTYIRKLGSGAYGTVHLCSRKDTGAKRAIKKVEKFEDFHDNGFLDEEVGNLVRLDHPNIVKLYEYYEDNKHIHLVMDYCSGGDLERAIESRASWMLTRLFAESYIAHVMRQILMAIAHVHAHCIVHLDLKTANIMLMPEHGTLPPAHRAPAERTIFDCANPHVMVIDFGVAQLFRPGNFKRNRPCGTPITMAPEVWRGEITPKADVFSCGCILFEMLSFQLPWDIDTVRRDEAIAYWNRQPRPPWHRVQLRSDDAVGVCKNMLTLDRNQRPIASDLLRTYFLKPSAPKADDEPTFIPENILDRLRKVTKRTILQKSVALAIARSWPSNQIGTIKRVFQELDMAGNGRLTKHQIAAALEQFGLGEAHAQHVADAMDFSRDGTVDWTEFVASCIHVGGDLLEADLKRVFEEADSNGDGNLDRSDVARLLSVDVGVESGVVSDTVAELVGADEDDVRLDWDTFRRHFRSEAGLQPVDATEGVAVQDTSRRSQDTSHRPQDANLGVAGNLANRGIAAAVELGLGQEAVENAISWVQRAYGAICQSEQEAPNDDAFEEALRHLREMGFSDRQKCMAALRRHHNAVTGSCVDELITESGP